MTLQYNILWFEDDEAVISALSPQIRDHVTGLGFEFNFEKYDDDTSLEERVSKRDYDLILTDLNLHDGALGDTLIKKIREADILTEVLLYSSNGDAIEKAHRRNAMIERISWAVGSGNDLLEKIKGIISLTVRKVQDLNNMRGLVVAEAISLEAQIKDILVDYFSAIPAGDPDTEKVMERIYKYRVESAEKTLKRLVEKFNAKMLVALIEDDALFTANNVIESIESILNDKSKILNVRISRESNPDAKKSLEESKEKIQELQNNLKLFKDEIIEIRNTLAHVKEEVLEDGSTVLQSRRKGATPILVNDETYVKMRTDIAKHKKNLAIIAEHLS